MELTPTFIQLDTWSDRGHEKHGKRDVFTTKVVIVLGVTLVRQG